MAMRQKAIALMRTLKKQSPKPLNTPLRRAFSLYDQINLIDNVPEDQLRFQGYTDTGFKVNGVDYQGSLLCVGNVLLSWSPKKFSEITSDSLSIFQTVRPIPEILVLGCGRYIQQVDPELRRFIRSTGMKLEAVDSNILLAGTDTSAATVVWAMTLLMKNPKAMRKAQEEVRDLVGKKCRFVDEDDLQKLPYLEAVIKETLRLHPVIPLLLPRITLQSCVVDGHEIKPKTLVYVNAYAIGRDPESWTDPEEFFPERFMVSNIDIKGLDFELIPFGAGRRKCPGISMGMATVKLALSNLLCSFDWELPDGMNKEDLDTDPMLGVVVQKKNDLCLVAKKI